VINRDTNFGLGKDPSPTCVDFGLMESRKLLLEEDSREQRACGRVQQSTPELKVGVFVGEDLEIRGVVNSKPFEDDGELPDGELPVYKAFNHTTQTWMAVKACHKTQSGRIDFNESIKLQHEASRHPNIVPIVAVIDNLNYICVVMDYYPDGDLFDNITQGRRDFNDNFIRIVFLQILDAVEHCHRLGIYHMDLKPENILVSGDKVLLTSFGLAIRDVSAHYRGTDSYISPGMHLNEYPTFFLLNYHHSFTPECCLSFTTETPFWSAPHNIWALGVILINLAFHRNPWGKATFNDPTYAAFRRDCNFLKTILPLSDELNSLLCLIFEHDPGRRIAIDELRRYFLSCPRFSA